MSTINSYVITVEHLSNIIVGFVLELIVFFFFLVVLTY